MNVRRVLNNTNSTNPNNHHHQACAACKYQRRKCQPDCTLAPYFPPTHQQQFLNAHKLFGVSNIVKSLKNLNSQFEKDEAMRTMIFEADARANDPVGGCYRMVCDLQQKLAFGKTELDLVNNQLAIFRSQVQMQMNEKKLGLMAMDPPFVGGFGGWVGQSGEPPPPMATPLGVVNSEPPQSPLAATLVVNGEGSSCSFPHLEQNPQTYMGMFADQLDALESIECGGKSEEGEETEAGAPAVETKPIESVGEEDSKEDASSPLLTSSSM